MSPHSAASRSGRLEVSQVTLGLFGIDAPEIAQVCRVRDLDYRCGIEATRALKALIGVFAKLSPSLEGRLEHRSHGTQGQKDLPEEPPCSVAARHRRGVLAGRLGFADRSGRTR